MFVGFSDITALHVALNNHGLATVYGSMPVWIKNDTSDWAIQSWLCALELKNPTNSMPPNLRARTLVPGTCRGVVAGGCLSLLARSIGTSHAFRGNGKIVLIEDVDEDPHRVDANLTQLLQSDSLDGAEGVLVGEMTGTNDRDSAVEGLASWEQIVAERLGALGIPVATHFPFGHVKNALSLPLGVPAVLDATNGTLTYD
jgi:muramoyltetrapeptide carboxypeptidase